MSEKWYPIINYENCIECGACIEKCQNGVFEKKSVKPKVVAPKGCTEGCRGCQVLCPADAIEYAGDFGDDDSCCVGCTCNCNS